MSRSHGSAHVFPQENLRRSRLSSDRRKPPRRRASASAGDRHAGPHRGFARQRAIGAVAAVYQLRRRREAILEKDHKLSAFVCDRLAEGWTPEQIAGWLRAGHERGLRVLGFEAIFSFFFSPAPTGDGAV